MNPQNPVCESCGNRRCFNRLDGHTCGIETCHDNCSACAPQPKEEAEVERRIKIDKAIEKSFHGLAPDQRLVPQPPQEGKCCAYQHEHTHPLATPSPSTEASSQRCQEHEGWELHVGEVCSLPNSTSHRRSLSADEWEKAFRNRFGNYGLYEDQEYMGHRDVMSEVESFIRSLLCSSREQTLNEAIERVDKILVYYGSNTTNGFASAALDALNEMKEKP